MTRAVPEKHIINFFGLTVQTSSEIIEHYSNILLKSTASLINIAGVKMLGAQVPAGTQHFSRELDIAS